MRALMSIDWEKLGEFVKAVGIPFTCLLLFTAPFIWMAFILFRKYVGRLAEAHLNFLESSARTQEQNAETLKRLEQTVAVKHQDHLTTHQAIGLVAKAGIDILDDDHQKARVKLEKVGTILKTE
jgi:hypothetical protein